MKEPEKSWQCTFVSVEHENYGWVLLVSVVVVVDLIHKLAWSTAGEGRGMHTHCLACILSIVQPVQTIHGVHDTHCSVTANVCNLQYIYAPLSAG